MTNADLHRTTKHTYRVVMDEPTSFADVRKAFSRFLNKERAWVEFRMAPNAVRAIRDQMTQDLRKH